MVLVRSEEFRSYETPSSSGSNLLPCRLRLGCARQDRPLFTRVVELLGVGLILLFVNVEYLHPYLTSLVIMHPLSIGEIVGRSLITLNQIVLMGLLSLVLLSSRLYFLLRRYAVDSLCLIDNQVTHISVLPLSSILHMPLFHHLLRFCCRRVQVLGRREQAPKG